MSRLGDRIPVEPLSEARWERIERRVLDARERAVEEVSLRPRGFVRRFAPAILGAAALGVAVLFLGPVIWHSGAPGKDVAGARAPVPARIVTPPGGASRVEIGDAVVEIGGETTVSVKVALDGAVELDLLRGVVDCDVAPRPGRPSFSVVASDVTVEVVGTRFTVERGDEVRVTVARGRVSVTSDAGNRMVAAGESWSARGLVAAAVPEALPAPATGEERATGDGSAPEVDRGRTEPGSSPAAGAKAAAGNTSPPGAGTAKEPAIPDSSDAMRTAYEAANELDATNPEEAARRYRAIAKGRGVYAAKALYSLAYLEHRAEHYQSAIKLTLEHERRFGISGANADPALSVRIMSLYWLGEYGKVREAARLYMDRYPDGDFAERARRMAMW